MIKNNYGHWVDSEIPSPGAVSMNSLEWVSEEIDYNSIDLTYIECEHYFIEEEIAAWEKDHDGESFDRIAHADLIEDWKVIFSDRYMDNGESEYLIGAWVADEHGMYFPDRENGEYAAIAYCGSNIVIVEWSKYVTRCALCSPCYPNSGDLDTAGKFLAYDLPMDLYGAYRQNENAQIEYIAPAAQLDPDGVGE